jgi:3-oxoacyl-[acyl-carrier protein] reductase
MWREKMNKDNKIAFITGASRGIGKAIAISLAKDGIYVIINYRNNEESAKEVLDEITNLGGNGEIIQGDISNFDESKEVIDKIVQECGKIDIMVNNAGITRDQLLLRMTEEDFDSVINVNLKGTFNCIKNVTRSMMKKRSGKIINIASVVGLSGNIGQSNYAASKAGIIGLTKSVAREFASRGIQVNAVAPGFIETDMTNTLSDQVKDELLKRIPLNKLGKPEDVANVVSFLASDKADYITGQVITVDGGMTI